MLRQGNTGNRVFRLQRELTLIATRQERPDFNPRRVDGIFGNSTRIAVINLQTAMGLRPDGVVGRLTEAAIRRLLNIESGAITSILPDAARIRPTAPRIRPAAARTIPGIAIPVITAPTRYTPPLTAAPDLTPAIDWRIIGIGVAIILVLMMTSTKEKKK
ncbi:MAG: hypothetical protein DDT22_00251 [candidate division WS2 bacterium]|nr:hypothetical protein [Bacillota bacterium]MBT9174591.1 hypothetical protein [Candidatus Lithacetigena glycinireducens]